MFRYVSLGCDCQVNYQISMVQDRGPTNFFDWIAVSLEGLTRLIEEDFAGILRADRLSPFYVENRLLGVIDTHFQADFHHDFLRMDEENRLRVLATYTRRAARFRQLFHPDSPPTYFVRRADQRDSDHGDAKAIQLLDLLQCYRKDVRLLYLHEDTRRSLGFAPGFRSAPLKQMEPFFWTGHDQAWSLVFQRTALKPFPTDGRAFPLPAIALPRFGGKGAASR